MGDIRFFLEFLRESGFEVKEVTHPEGDVVIVLGCTSLDDETALAFLDYVEEGGSLIVDARGNNRLLTYLNVGESFVVRGRDEVRVSLYYSTIDGGVLVEGALAGPGSPFWGYEKMYYVGRGIRTPQDWTSLMVTENGVEVAAIKGNVSVVGCLLCADPLFIQNLVDYLEDGKNDFPRVDVRRYATPRVVKWGDTVEDIVEVTVSSPDVEVQVSYPYETGDYCSFPLIRGEIGDIRPEDGGYTQSTRFVYRAEGRSCELAPVIVKAVFEGKEREITVRGQRITVEEEGLLVGGNYLLPGLLIVLALLTYFGLGRLKRSSLIKRWKRVKLLMRLTKRRYMKREIDEETYKRLISDYQKELDIVEAEMRMLGIPIPEEDRDKH